MKNLVFLKNKILIDGGDDSYPPGPFFILALICILPSQDLSLEGKVYALVTVRR